MDEYSAHNDAPDSDDEATEESLSPISPDAALHSFEELDALADNDGLTRESLQAELNKYAEAYRQEYELNTNVDPANVEEYTQDFFRKNVHQAAAQIVWLASNAESESVRGNMAKYVVEQAIKDSDNAGDPIKDLLNRLTANSDTPDADSGSSKYKSVQ